jgi:hypothetical protein
VRGASLRGGIGYLGLADIQVVNPIVVWADSLQQLGQWHGWVRVGYLGLADIQVVNPVEVWVDSLQQLGQWHVYLGLADIQIVNPVEVWVDICSSWVSGMCTWVLQTSRLSTL